MIHHLVANLFTTRLLSKMFTYDFDLNIANPTTNATNKPSTAVEPSARSKRFSISKGLSRSSSKPDIPSKAGAPAGAMPFTFMQPEFNSTRSSLSEVTSKSSRMSNVKSNHSAPAVTKSTVFKEPERIAHIPSLYNLKSQTSSKADVRIISNPEPKTAMSKVFSRLKFGIPRSNTSPALLISSPILEAPADHFQLTDTQPYVDPEVSQLQERIEAQEEFEGANTAIKPFDLQQPARKKLQKQQEKKAKRVAIALPESQDQKQEDERSIEMASEDAYKSSDTYKQEREREQAKVRAEAVMARLDAILGPKQPAPCLYTTLIYTCSHWTRPLTEDQIKHSSDCPGGRGPWQRCGNRFIKSDYQRMNRKCARCQPEPVERQPASIAQQWEALEDDDSDDFIDSDEEGHWEGGFSMEDSDGRLG